MNSMNSTLVRIPRVWRKPSRTRRAEGFVSAVRRAASDVAASSDAELREASEALRAQITAEGPDRPALQIQAFALMCEALQRVRQVQLFDVQLLAASVLSRGSIAEMQTGEGKTFACAPAAYLHGLTGRGVHVATPNAYLAQRDFELLSPALQALGVSVGLLTDNASHDAKRAAYLCDITYGTGYEFGFDYLRDQLAWRQRSARPLGQTLWSRMRGSHVTEAHDTIQRRLYYAIVDEIDNVLLDDAGSPLVLSGPTQEEATDADAHRLARLRSGISPAISISGSTPPPAACS